MPTKVILPKAGEVLLHDRWIRERCACSICVHDATKQPYTYTPTNCVVTNVKEEEESEKLTFCFSDGHSVSLPKNTLESELMNFSSTCSVQSNLDTSIPERILWNKETFSLDEYSFDDMLHNNNETRINILESLLKYGIVLVSETPREDKEVLRFSRELLGSVRETHWGVVFDVRATSPPKEGVAHDLAYSGAEIEFHVDNPYRTPCIDYQLLHCIESRGVAEGEGLSRFVDAVRCAEQLRTQDPEAFEILKTTEVKWENNHPLMTICPMIQLDINGKITRVFHSLKSGGYAPPIAPEKLEKFYAAKDKLISLFEDEKNVALYRLREGDLIFFVNSRILHARTKFNPSVASRHLQGMYVDHDAVTSALWRYRSRSSSKIDEETTTKFEPTWSALNHASQDELDEMSKRYQEDNEKNQVRRVLDLLIRQKGEHTKLGAPVDLYTHGLQTATRALQAGEDDDLVVAALLHDLGELFTPTNHGEFSAALLRPYVSERVCWILEHHEIFQLKNYGKDGCNVHVIERYRGMPYFDDCEKFCLEYDQSSFDPAFKNLPLETFEPIVKRVFSRRPYWHTPNHAKASCVLQLD